MKRSLLLPALGLVSSLAACHSRPLTHQDAAEGDGSDGAGGREASREDSGDVGEIGVGSGGTDAGVDAASDADASSGDAEVGRSPDCPPSWLVLTSDPCKPGTICDYRAPGAYPTCFDRIECQGNKTWNQTRSSKNCEKPTNDPSCPARFTALPEDSDCAPGIGTCFYDEGQCGCLACSIGGPAVQGSWDCQAWNAGGKGCPAEPPLAGDLCATPDVGCGYDGYGGSSQLGAGYACIDGVWQVLRSPMGISAIPRCPQTMTCGFTTAPGAPDAAVLGLPAEQYATAAALGEYDALIGRFLRGDATVYSGNFSASVLERASDSDAYRPGGGFREGAALAALDVRATAPFDWWPPIATPPAGSRTAVLVVHALDAKADLLFAQRSDDTPGTTWFSSVGTDSSAFPGPNRLITSCASCLPPLTPPAGGILINGGNGAQVMGTGMVPGDGGFVQVQLLTSLQGQLGRVDPCALRWTQLAQLATTTGPDEVAADPGLRGYVDSGDELVKHIVNKYIDRVLTRATCGTMTSYTLDLWVKKADLGAHGVRNYTVTSTQMVCGA
jgi:hypothetical protein